MKNHKDTSKNKKIRKNAQDKFLVESAARHITTGFGENYLGAFAVILGAGEIFMSILTSLPTLFASILQIISPYFMKKYGVRRKLVLNGVLIHALSWFCLLFVFLVDPAIGIWILLLLIIIQTSVEWFINCAWMSWFGEYVDKKTMGKYIGLKNSISLLFSMTSTIIAGVILGFFESSGSLYGFVIIFAISFLARAFTFFNLNSIPPTNYNPKKTKTISPLQFLKEKRHEEIHSFINFIGLFRFVVMIASPFFTLYMLRDLNFTYVEYMIFISLTIFTQVVSMHYWGGITQKYGNGIVLKYSSILIAFIPLLWLVSQDFNYLIFIRIFDGFIWGAFNLSAYNYLLSSSSLTERSAYVSNYNLFTGLATFLGAIIGGFIAIHSLEYSLFLVGIPLVFLISGILRLIISLTFGLKIKEKLMPYQHKGEHMFVKIMLIYPMEGARQSLLHFIHFKKSKS